MKKNIAFFFTLVISSALYAQDLPKLGIKAGLNMSNLAVDNNLDEYRDYKAGFHGGLLAHIHTGNKNFAIQPEVVYSLQGSSFDSYQGSPEQDINLHYINVPVLVQYMFDNGFRIQTGPQVGLLVGAKSEVNGVDSDIKNDFKTGDFSWSFGGGYLSYSGLGIDLRYNLGISNINDFPGGADTKNRVFQVGLFYMFDQNHKAKSR